MNTTQAIARIITAADQLPEPARAAAHAELWKVQRLTPAGQSAAVHRWQAAMASWPSAGAL